MDGKLTIHIAVEVDPRLVHEVVRLLFPSLPDLQKRAGETRQMPQPQSPSASLSTDSTAQASTAEAMQRSCCWCGAVFTGRSGQVYCGNGCKEKAKRHRAIERRIERDGAKLDSPPPAPLMLRRGRNMHRLFSYSRAGSPVPVGQGRGRSSVQTFSAPMNSQTNP